MLKIVHSVRLPDPKLSLYRLPPELRIEIFRWLLKSDSPIEIAYWGSKNLGYVKGFSNSISFTLRDSRGLFLAGKRISEEALQVLESGLSRSYLKQENLKMQKKFKNSKIQKFKRKFKL